MSNMSHIYWQSQSGFRLAFGIEPDKVCGGYMPVWRWHSPDDIDGHQVTTHMAELLLRWVEAGEYNTAASWSERVDKQETKQCSWDGSGDGK